MPKIIPWIYDLATLFRKHVCRLGVRVAWWKIKPRPEGSLKKRRRFAMFAHASFSHSFLLRKQYNRLIISPDFFSINGKTVRTVETTVLPHSWSVLMIEIYACLCGHFFARQRNKSRVRGWNPKRRYKSKRPVTFHRRLGKPVPDEMMRVSLN